MDVSAPQAQFAYQGHPSRPMTPASGGVQMFRPSPVPPSMGVPRPDSVASQSSVSERVERGVSFAHSRCV